MNNILLNLRLREFGNLPQPKTCSSLQFQQTRELLKRCVVKDDKQCLRDMGDARLDLDVWDAMMEATFKPTPKLLWHALPWVIAAFAIVIAAWAMWHRATRNVTPAEVMHLDIPYPRTSSPFPPLDSRSLLTAKVSR